MLKLSVVVAEGYLQQKLQVLCIVLDLCIKLQKSLSELTFFVYMLAKHLMSHSAGFNQTFRKSSTND